MKSPNNEGDGTPTCYLMSTNEYFGTGMAFIQFSCLLKGFHENPQIIQDIVITIGCSPQMNSKFPLLKTNPTQFIEHAEVKLVPM